MRAVIQRVTQSEVRIENVIKSSIGNGMMILLGIEDEDNLEDVYWLAKKISSLRIFNDDKGIMNLSLSDTDGEAMVVSQFTLHAKTKKGNRPSYIKAAKPEIAIPIYNKFVDTLQDLINRPVATGEFGAMMEISLINSGPVTIIIDTKNRE